jgi:hypothetical protein
LSKANGPLPGSPEPLPGFIEITFAAAARGVKVGLENMQGIEQKCQGQPSQGLRFRTATAAREELGRLHGGETLFNLAQAAFSIDPAERPTQRQFPGSQTGL